MSVSRRHLKSLWLLYIYLLQYAIQKCGFNIHLMNVLIHLCSYGHDSANGSIPRYWGKCLVVVDALNL